MAIRNPFDDKTIWCQTLYLFPLAYPPLSSVKLFYSSHSDLSIFPQNCHSTWIDPQTGLFLSDGPMVTTQSEFEIPPTFWNNSTWTNKKTEFLQFDEPMMIARTQFVFFYSSSLDLSILPLYYHPIWTHSQTELLLPDKPMMTTLSQLTIWSQTGGILCKHLQHESQKNKRRQIERLLNRRRRNQRRRNQRLLNQRLLQRLLNQRLRNQKRPKINPGKGRNGPRNGPR